MHSGLKNSTQIKSIRDQLLIERFNKSEQFWSIFFEIFPKSWFETTVFSWSANSMNLGPKNAHLIMNLGICFNYSMNIFSVLNSWNLLRTCIKRKWTFQSNSKSNFGKGLANFFLHFFLIFETFNQQLIADWFNVDWIFKHVMESFIKLLRQKDKEKLQS